MIQHLGGLKSARLSAKPTQLRMSTSLGGRNTTTTRKAPGKVLLTNDDGPESPFFHKFATGLRESLRWNTFVCIPDSNWSYVSKSVSKTKNFEVNHVSEEEVHVPISPASCVNLGLYELCQDCDLVLSGPNIGHNLGRSAVLSSGTVGAAIEGCLHGRKAIAVSFPFKGWYSWTDDDIDGAVEVALDVTQSLWNNWDDTTCPAGSTFYNVNVPLWACNKTKVDTKSVQWIETGIDETVGYTSLFKVSEEEKQGAKVSYSWSPGGERVFDSENPQKGGDVAAVKQGHVSISKLRPNFQSMVS